MYSLSIRPSLGNGYQDLVDGFLSSIEEESWNRNGSFSRLSFFFYYKKNSEECHSYTPSFYKRKQKKLDPQ